MRKRRPAVRQVRGFVDDDAAVTRGTGCGAHSKLESWTKLSTASNQPLKGAREPALCVAERRGFIGCASFSAAALGGRGALHRAVVAVTVRRFLRRRPSDGADHRRHCAGGHPRALPPVHVHERRAGRARPVRGTKPAALVDGRPRAVVLLPSALERTADGRPLDRGASATLLSFTLHRLVRRPRSLRPRCSGVCSPSAKPHWPRCSSWPRPRIGCSRPGRPHGTWRSPEHWQFWR